MKTKGEQFAGLTVALVTPFRNGEIDFDELRRLVDWHVEQGTDCLSPVGTTGESPTLDHDEHERIIAAVVERAAGRIRTMPGTGSNSQGKINIVTAPIKGLLMPDAVSTWTVGGVTYFATANEGDSRVDGSDEARLSALDLNDAVFGSQEAALKSEDYAGRLTVSNIDGDTDPTQAGVEEIFTFGGRGMSIFRQNADGTITKVSDTGGEFEKIIASLPDAGTAFNRNGEADGVSFDTRSDNKAGEPEGIDVDDVVVHRLLHLVDVSQNGLSHGVAF